MTDIPWERIGNDIIPTILAFMVISYAIISELRKLFEKDNEEYLVDMVEKLTNPWREIPEKMGELRGSFGELSGSLELMLDRMRRLEEKLDAVRDSINDS